MRIQVDDLKKIPLFSDLDQEILGELATMGYNYVLPIDSQGRRFIIDPSAYVRDVYIVVNGEVEAKWRPASRHGVSVSEWARPLHLGDVPCHSEILLGRPCMLKVVAAGGSRFLRFDVQDFSRIIMKYPQLYDKLLPRKLLRSLRAMPLLKDIPDDILIAIADLVEEKKLKPGETHRGNVERPIVWMVDSGQLQIWPVARKKGKEQLVGPGFFFPDAIPACSQFQTGYTVQAKVGTTLLGLPSDLIYQLGIFVPAFRHRLYDVGLTPSQPPPRPTSRTVPGSQEAGVQPSTPPEAIMGVNLIDPISRTELFSGYSAEAAHFILGFFSWKHIPQDLSVIKQGSPDRTLYILIEGDAVIRSIDVQGRSRPRRYMSPGEVIGVNSFLNDKPSEISAQAVAPTTWLALYYKDFEKANQIWKARHHKRWYQRRQTDAQDLRQGLHLPPGVDLPEAKGKKKEKKWWALRPNETLLWEGRAHIIVLMNKLVLPIGLLFFVAILCLGLGSYFGLGPYDWRLLLVLGGLVVLGLLGWTAYEIRNYYNDTYLLTDQRVLSISRIPLIEDKRQEVALDMIQDVNVIFRTRTGRIYNYGTVRMETAAMQGALVFSNIPKPSLVAGEMRAQIAVLKARRVASRRETLREELTQRLKGLLLPKARQQVIPDEWFPSRYYPPSLLQIWYKAIVQAPFNFIAHGLRSGFRLLGKLFLPLKRSPSWLLAKLHGKPLLLTEEKKPTPNEQTGPNRFARMVLVSWREGDTYVWRKSYFNWLERVGGWLSGVILGVFLLYLALHSHQVIFIIIASLLLLIAFLKTAWEAIDWGNDQYILTRTEIIDVEKKPLFAHESRHSAPLSKVQNLSSEMKGFWHSLLRYGNVRIQTAGSEGMIVFAKVNRPGEIQKIISKRLNEYRKVEAEREMAAQRRILLDGLEVYDEMQRQQ